MGLVISIIFLIISILLLMGKGSFLIAGYNTASEKEKAKYNEKKLCRIVGLGFLVMTCGLFSLFMLKDIGLYIMIGTFIIGMAIIFIGSEYASVERNQKKMKMSIGIGVLITVIFGAFIMGVMFIGDIDIEYNDDCVQLSGTFVSSSKIDYDDILKVEYCNDFDIGRKKNGINNAVVEAGRYYNDEFGHYRLYAYTYSSHYVIIYTENEIFVVSGENEKQTQNIYNQLSSYKKATLSHVAFLAS
jgi:hypothetical protein